MDEPGFAEFIKGNLESDPVRDSIRIRTAIWKKYRVLVVGNWKLEDLVRLQAGFDRLRVAVGNAVGEVRVDEYSHIWGAGGTIDFKGDKTVRGQFGSNDYARPFTTDVVGPLKNFSVDEVAKRIAHEASHSNDKVLGYIRTGTKIPWTQESSRALLRACTPDKPLDPPPQDDRVSFYDCRKLKQELFSYFPSDYAAINASEFYTKMVDHWVEDQLKKRPASYACKSEQTFRLWREMEAALIGTTDPIECPSFFQNAIFRKVSR